MYKTNSLPLAAYLRTLTDLEFKGVDKTNFSKVEFMFDPADKAQKCSDEYFAGTSKVNPIQLFESYRALKDLIFEIRRNNNNIEK